MGGRIGCRFEIATGGGRKGDDAAGDCDDDGPVFGDDDYGNLMATMTRNMSLISLSGKTPSLSQASSGGSDNDDDDDDDDGGGDLYW